MKAPKCLNHKRCGNPLSTNFYQTGYCSFDCYHEGQVEARDKEIDRLKSVISHLASDCNATAELLTRYTGLISLKQNLIAKANVALKDARL